jgi:hypothetical protein
MFTLRTMGVDMSIGFSRVLTMVAVFTAFLPLGAAAKSGFGEKVDAYCSGLGRGTPFADLAGGGFLSECTLCHQFTYPPELPEKSNKFDPPAAAYLANNLGYFCPGVTNRPPVITPIADRSVNVAEMVVIDVLASDADGDPIVLSVANAPAGSSFVDHENGSATFSWTPGAGDLGSHGVDFLAQDDAVPPGQALEAVSISVGDSNRPPVLGAIGHPTGDPGLPLEIAVAATDPDGDKLELSATPLPVGASFSDAGDGTGMFSWTPDTSQLGNHRVTFRAQDTGVPAASDSEEVTITIGQVNAPPVLAPIGNRSVRAGQALSIALSAQDPDAADQLVFSATGLPAAAILSDNHDGTGVIDWLPSAGEIGVYDVTLSVSDDVTPPESDSESFALTVEAESPPSGVRIDEARWDAERGKLRLHGSGAKPLEPIGLLDAGSGLVLRSKKADRSGGVGFKLDPMIVPCEVQLQAGDARSAAVPVQGAPASCGQELRLQVRARWKCGKAGHEDEAELRVRGGRAPSGAAIAVRHAATDALLATAQASSRGRFKVETSAPTQPTALDVVVSAGGLDWTLESVPVASDSCRAADDDDGDDDDDRMEKPE